MTRWIAFSLLLLCAAQASAGELRKCRLTDGRSSYTSEACPAASREVWTRATADADPAEARAEIERRRAETARWAEARWRDSRGERAASRRYGMARAGRASAANACDTAKAQRARTRDREWQRMTYDRMIALDQQVSDACR